MSQIPEPLRIVILFPLIKQVGEVVLYLSAAPDSAVAVKVNTS